VGPLNSPWKLLSLVPSQATHYGACLPYSGSGRILLAEGSFESRLCIFVRIAE
jgi:hypothetical protein